jgi:hypothetical protein
MYLSLRRKYYHRLREGNLLSYGKENKSGTEKLFIEEFLNV